MHLQEKYINLWGNNVMLYRPGSVMIIVEGGILYSQIHIHTHMEKHSDITTNSAQQAG